MSADEGGSMTLWDAMKSPKVRRELQRAKAARKNDKKIVAPYTIRTPKSGNNSPDQTDDLSGEGSTS